MTLISFIICSYNAPDLIEKCLNSILKQKYECKKEILIIDGGSDTKTLELLSEYKRKFKEIKLIHNKNQLPEGKGMGKWLGWKKAKGDFIFIIDQDNEIEKDNFIEEMLYPFKEENIFGCACRLRVDHKDSLTNQYVALVGTDPFFAYRSLDGRINLRKLGKDKGNYTLVELNKNNPIITGGNCFVYKKDILDKFGGYVQDTENILKLSENNYNKIAIPKNQYTHHMATKGFFDFIRKKKKWAKTYKGIKGKFSYLPKNLSSLLEFIINLLLIVLIIPNLIISIIKFIETREKAWLLHPTLTFITGFIYFYFISISWFNNQFYK